MALFTDIGLTLRIKSALITDDRLRARDINVDTAEEVVTLRGTVTADPLRDLAEEIALREGARLVINALALEDRTSDPPRALIPDDFPRIAPRNAASLAPPLTMREIVSAALVADPRVNAHLAIVHVLDGVAFLTGRQDTVDARDAASEVALQVSGIREVVNDMEVKPSV